MKFDFEISRVDCMLLIPGVSVVQTGEDLFGKERFTADGLATESECQELINLARVGTLKCLSIRTPNPTTFPFVPNGK